MGREEHLFNFRYIELEGSMGQRDDKTLGYLDQSQTILVVYVPIQAPTGFINEATDECYQFLKGLSTQVSL